MKGSLRWLEDGIDQEQGSPFDIGWWAVTYILSEHTSENWGHTILKTKYFGQKKNHQSQWI